MIFNIMAYFIDGGNDIRLLHLRTIIDEVQHVGLLTPVGFFNALNVSRVFNTIFTHAAKTVDFYRNGAKFWLPAKTDYTEKR